MFSVKQDGREKRVNGFFLGYFRYERTVCRVIGEVVDGQIDRNIRRVHGIADNVVSPPTTQLMSPVHTIASPSEQRVERRQRKEVAWRCAKRVEPSPTPEQSIFDEFLSWCTANPEWFKDADDSIDWSWMLDYATLPYDSAPFLGVDGLGTTPTIGYTQAESVAPPVYNLAASSRNNGSAINAMPDGSQTVEEMSLAEAYRQGFIAGQNQAYGFQWFS